MNIRDCNPLSTPGSFDKLKPVTNVFPVHPVARTYLLIRHRRVLAFATDKARFKIENIAAAWQSFHSHAAVFLLFITTSVIMNSFYAMAGFKTGLR